MLEIRGSEYQEFMRCRLRHKLRWVDGWIPMRQNTKLFFGTLYHRFLEVYYHTRSFDEGMKAMKEMFDETDTTMMLDDELSELWDLSEKVAYNYVAKWDDSGWTTLATELKFSIPLDDQISFTGTIDLIVKDHLGNIILLDHKTTSSLESFDKKSDTDRQISRYIWAVQQIAKGNGEVFDKNGNRHPAEVFVKRMGDFNDIEFIYNLILKEYPEAPKQLAKGGLSKDKRQKTTYDLYMRAIEELELDVNDYQDILEHLQHYPKEFFRRVEVSRLQPELDASIQEFYYTSIDIAGFRSGLEMGKVEMAYRNITKDCSWDCQYLEACTAGMDGSDVQHIFDSMYTKEEL